MTKPWTRDDTRHWIAHLENRLEDIDYYLNRTVEWCEDRGVYNDQAVFACAVMTVVWVSHMRQEPLSKREVLELVGVADYYNAEDEEYHLSPRFQNYELEEILELVAEHWLD
jgi:hypothetical protein